MNKKNRTILITGSTGGIGTAIAREFAQPETTIILHTRHRRHQAETLLQEIEARGAQGKIIQADLESCTERKDFLDQVRKASAPVEVLVHAAGRDLMSPEMKALSFSEKMERLFHLDVLAAVEISRDLSEQMVNHGNGYIFFFSWDGVQTGWKGDTAELYGMAKGALWGYARSLAERIMPEVKVRCLAPGWIQTRWGEQAPQRVHETVADDSLMQRWGTAEEIAKCVRFLSSRESDYIDAIPLKLNGTKKGSRVR